MFTAIVVGTDDSPNARRYDVDTVLVVSGYRPLSETESEYLTHDLPQELGRGVTADQGGVARTCAAVRHLNRMGLHAVTHAVTHAVPTAGAEAIRDVAGEVAADLVVGSRGRGAGKRLPRGGVSTEVLHREPCSVLVVHGED